ncbi:hypothetical protein DD238_004741 [Peronospora effusa]|uniref:BSD domain-containing protein n=1 Tax=Peronospora effusa TaxID=542832 RepID=A0A3M6VGB4_9STRA|nr:hypothetical protein DD238_004741 [Peronospora effusa]
MSARINEIGMSYVRASEIGMRHSAANLQMIAGTVANKAHVIATILSRGSNRVRRQRQIKTVPTAKAEDENSPLSQQEELHLPEPEAEVPNVEPIVSVEKQQEIKAEKEKELPPLLPWEVRIDGTTRENLIVKQKILELAIYRRTFVEPADGEEEYEVNYAVLNIVAKELLLSNPNLREKRETLVKSIPVAVVSEEVFWRNFFLRCNAVRLSENMPSYLPEARQTPMFTNPLARLRRGLFRKPRLSANSGKSRRGFLTVGGSISSISDKTSPSDDDPSDLELDVDGEIEKELVKRRPSRAVELCVQPVPPSQHNDFMNPSAAKPESTSTSKEPENTPGANSPNQSEESEKQV